MLVNTPIFYNLPYFGGVRSEKNRFQGGGAKQKLKAKLYLQEEEEEDSNYKIHLPTYFSFFMVLCCCPSIGLSFAFCVLHPHLSWVTVVGQQTPNTEVSDHTNPCGVCTSKDKT